MQKKLAVIVSYTNYSWLCLFQIELQDENSKILVFFKLQPEVVTPSNMRKIILVSSMIDSPVSTLYHVVQKIFAPMLLKDQKWSKSIDPKLMNLVSQIEGALGSAFRKQDFQHSGDGDDGSFTGNTISSGLQ